MPGDDARFPVSDHCDGRRFFNPTGHVDRTFRDILRWKLGSRPARWPARVALTPVEPPVRPEGDGLVATWVGHASFLVQSAATSVLIDPVWGERAGPLGFLGPRRVHAPGLRFESLPEIGVVLLSHDHYDHCDLGTLERVARTWDPVFVAPLGNGSLLRRAGARRVIELDWWESCEPGHGIQVVLTPSRHWSNRLTGPRNGRLWGGFSVRAGGRLAHFVGDTGYLDGLFVEIRRRLGAPDLAFIPIGAYEPRWFMAPQHCNPEEAVLIHRELGAARSIAMHWGCWQLTDEAREAPVEGLGQALAAAGLQRGDFLALQPGESLSV